MKTAIVLGATGLVGKQLLKKLLINYAFDSVKIFVRRSAGVQHPKLKEYIIDFDKPDEWKHLVTGDVLFSAFGTTLATAGSKEAQYKIDYTYQHQMAAIAAANKVPVYVLVSAANSSPDSMIFYSRMKGELERDVALLPFRSVHILRPGLLAGKREQKRTGEELGFKVLSVLAKVPLFRKYKPIQDEEVARAMIHCAVKENTGVHKYGPLELFELAGKEM
jgi:uncharacterized protein YbjT (DUF2867 family)